MHLTRFRINTARTGSRRLLSSPQSLHAAVMSAFPALLPTAPDQSVGNTGPRVLWRLDHNARAEVFLYVVSPDRPDLTHLVEQAGWPALAADTATPGWETRPYTPLLDRLDKGGTWGFRLTANPVHSVRNKDGAPTKRTAHINPVHQMGWLLKQQERAGFRILEKPDQTRLLPAGTTHQGHPHHGDRYELTVRDQRDLSFAKSREERGNKRTAVTLVTATFDGHLEVTDPQLLRHTLTHGLGKAKAYGCGLMTLAPLTPAPAR